MSKYDSRRKVEDMLESSVKLVSPKISSDLKSISQIDELVSSFLRDSGLQDFLGLVRDVFQIEKIKKNGEFAKGFPGIVLTSIVGRLLDESYNPRNNFYYINPRPLFEQHIRPVLRDKYHAPMGMSDPLNVAKNMNIIDENWAKGKRPEYASKAAAELINHISQIQPVELEKFLNALVYIYLCLARLYTAEIPNFTGSLDIQVVNYLLRDLISNAPAGGATAQIVAGCLLNVQHELFEKEKVLLGIGESVYTTNTTSKKPGDLQEVFGGNLHVYEVTTKKVDDQRLIDSSDAVMSYLRQQKLDISRVDITFICRRDDVALTEIRIAENSSILSTISYNDLDFTFMDIWCWIENMLERIGAAGREKVIDQVRSYVELPTTHLDVKAIWAMLVARIPE